jgi:predicted metal-binding protein
MEPLSYEKYIDKALARGATDAKTISTNSVVTAPWVRLKCQFGCPYKNRYCCPPDTPTPEQMRVILDSYRDAILFHIEAPRTPERGKQLQSFFESLVELEGELFKDGLYKAFAILAGPCSLCKECGKVKGTVCNFPHKARPSMESCGIDVFQTVRNNEFFIQTLREKTETQNIYCLMLVD